MAITTRDVILVLRAKDEATQTIRGVSAAFGTLGSDAYNSGARMIAAGGALLGLGAAIGTVGAGLLGLTKEMISTSMAYQQQAALTLTQVDQTGASLEQIKQIGLDVARYIPVPFDEVQQGLYQIFSSMDVSVADAGKILEAFAKGAVGGQTDLQVAGAATIGIMNAFGLGIEDLGRVQDVQFQLVRKGVGTYEDFANSIGLSLPSAARAGQSIELLSGMLAFLTRNGLSASRASTSAARALDLLSNPKTVERMEDMGIVVRKNNGEFADIDYIVTQLGKKLEGLTGPEKAAALQELFKGAGNNIQARRFWDVAISNYDELNQRVDEMQNAAGEAQAAYDIMFVQPQTQIDLLKNKMKVLATVLGDFLMPKFQELLDLGNQILDWFLDLNPETQKFIAYAIALSGILFVATGALLGVSGAFLIFAGALKMAGGIANIIAVLGPYALILAAIAGAAFLIYKNWDKLKPFWDKYWPEVKEKTKNFLDWLRETWDKYWPGIKDKLTEFWETTKALWAEYWPQIKAKTEEFLNWLQAKWTEYWPGIKQAILDTLAGIQAAWEYVWPRLKEAVQAVVDWFRENWPLIRETFNTVKDAIVEAITWIVNNIDTFWNKCKDIYNYIVAEFGPGLVAVWLSIKENIGPIVEDIWIIIQKAWDLIKVLTEWLWPYVKAIIVGAFGAAVASIEVLWNILAAIFEGGLEMIRGILDIIAGLLTGDWARMWEGAKHIVHGFYVQVTGIFSAFWEFIKDIFRTGARVATMIITAMKDDLIAEFKAIATWLQGRGAAIKREVGDLSMLLYNAGKSVIQGFWNGMKSVWESAKGWLAGIKPDITDLKGPPAADAVALINNGRLIMQGFQKGMEQQWGDTARWLSGLAPSMPNMVGAAAFGSGRGGGTNINVAQGAVQLTVGSVRDDDDLDKIQQIVDQKFGELVREMSQPRYGSNYG